MLPQLKDINRLQIKLSDAELITAFAQERQRMSKKKRVPRQSLDFKIAAVDSALERNHANLQRTKSSPGLAGTPVLHSGGFLTPHIEQQPQAPKHTQIDAPYVSQPEIYHHRPSPRPTDYNTPSDSIRGASLQPTRVLPNISRHSHQVSQPTSRPRPEFKEVHRLVHPYQAPTLTASYVNPRDLNPTQQIPTAKPNSTYQRGE